MKKRKILILINDATIGGGQVHILDLLSRMSKIKFAFIVACSPRGELLGKFRERSDVFHPVRMEKGTNLLSLFKIFHIIRHERVDIVHTHGGIAGLWGRVAAFLVRGVMVVHTFHGIHFLHYENARLKRIFVYLERCLSRFTDVSICVSESDRRNGLKYRLFDSSRCRVIHNGVDLGMGDSKSHFSKRELGLDEDTRIVLHVGRFDPVKGQIYLLEAFKSVVEAVPNVRLLIIGDGPLKKRLETCRDGLGLDGLVQFLGVREDIRSILSVSDVFVLSSLWEGLPLSVLEAMACGKPVVATNVDGIREVVESGKEGLLVPPKNALLLAEAILRLLKDKALARRMGQKGRKKVAQGFRVDRMMKKTEEIYSMVGG